jgi:hypothetical protein
MEGWEMKKYALTALTTGALASATLAFAGAAAAAPTGPSNVNETVRTLEASGYNVIVNKTGAAPLADCTVSAVRPGQTHSTTDSRGGGSLNTTVTSQTVYVDVAC